MTEHDQPDHTDRRDRDTLTCGRSVDTLLTQVADDVRRAVVATVRHLTDLEPVQVTVLIDDVFTEP